MLIKKSDIFGFAVLFIFLTVSFLYWPLVIPQASEAKPRETIYPEITEIQAEMRALGLERVRWDGLIRVDNSMPAAGEANRIRTPVIYIPGLEPFGFIVFNDITINQDAIKNSGFTIELALRKELLANAVAMDWCVENRCEPRFGDEQHVLIDGLAFLYLSEEFEKYYNREFQHWDGITTTCATYLEVNYLSEQGIINSGGILEILERENCN